MDKPLIRLCAVAKDEGPYLAEWIFHHLHVGFDQIHVILNRTSDHSSEILQRISKDYPQVTSECIDWVDLCDPGVGRKLQTIAYAKGLEAARREKVDWLMFLDIDEFWMAEDFVTRVDQFIASTCVDDSSPICFLWHCELGQDQTFSPLRNGSGYELSSHLKTLFPIQGAEIRHVRIHCPIFGKGVVPLDANGNPMVFKKDEPELACDSIIEPKKAYVIHRMYRSEDEYLALLLRGRPSDRKALKTNRRAYRSHRNVAVKLRYIWPKEAFKEYRRKKSKFMSELAIDMLVNQDRAAILDRAAEAVAMLTSMLKTPERETAVKVLKGTRHWSSMGDVPEELSPGSVPIALPASREAAEISSDLVVERQTSRSWLRRVVDWLTGLRKVPYGAWDSK